MNEVGELYFGDRAKAVVGRADADPDDRRFRQRRIDDALAVLGVQPFRGAKDSACFDVFAQQEDAVVPGHLLVERAADCFDDGHRGHQSSSL